MAVASASKQRNVSGKKRNIDGLEKEEKSEEHADISKVECAVPPKRNNRAGVRVVGGRIYDSQNGKTCHQCRQKTLDFVTVCKNQGENKPCSVKFCHKCLLNRYGEKAADVAGVENWHCPKCRGICNCSVCMKKRGHQPTGILVHTAKATGFSSVSELLNVKGPEHFSFEKTAKEQNVMMKKQKLQIVSPRRSGKENSFDKKVDLNLLSLPQSPDCIEKQPKKMKIHGDRGNVGALSEEINAQDGKKKIMKLKQEVFSDMLQNGDNNSSLGKHSSKPHKDKPKKMKQVKFEGVRNITKGMISEQKDPKKTEATEHTHKSTNVFDSMKSHHCSENKTSLKHENSDLSVDLSLLQGTELTTIAGIDLTQEDVGNALQFIEFCSAFGKILDVKKGRAESILRDLIHGRSGRRGKYAQVVQFHIQLLSIIQKESGEVGPTLSPTNGKNSWLHAMKKCISESQGVLNSFPLDILERGSDGYDGLDSSRKLELMNFLCDEVLETVKIRDWIDEENLKFSLKIKEAKDRISAAKLKEKCLRQKMQDEIAQAVIAKKGASLSISEHGAIISQIKHETAQAHTEILESKGTFPKYSKHSDAVRIKPILNVNGRVCWRLKGCPHKSILLQDVGADNTFVPSEKWFSLDLEQETTIEKHVRCLRVKRLKPRKVYETCVQTAKLLNS